MVFFQRNFGEGRLKFGVASNTSTTISTFAPSALTHKISDTAGYKMKILMSVNHFSNLDVFQRSK